MTCVRVIWLAFEFAPCWHPPCTRYQRESRHFGRWWFEQPVLHRQHRHRFPPGHVQCGQVAPARVFAHVRRCIEGDVRCRSGHRRWLRQPLFRRRVVAAIQHGQRQRALSAAPRCGYCSWHAPAWARTHMRAFAHKHTQLRPQPHLPFVPAAFHSHLTPIPFAFHFQFDSNGIGTRIRISLALHSPFAFHSHSIRI